MKAASILETIGNTPHIRLTRLFGDAEVWVKSERANPGASIKDRIALSMIEDAERSGKLKPGGTIIEPTSGNTGIGLAMVAAVKGYKLVLVMPESMSLERRRLMLAYGATFDLTPREKGMKGAIARAEELIARDAGQLDAAAIRKSRQSRGPPPHHGAGDPRGFPRFADRRADHRRRHRRPYHRLRRGAEGGMAGPEGVRGRADPVAGPLRRRSPARTRSRASAPASSPRIMNVSLLDGIIQVDPADAKDWARRAAREEGLLVGISSGATLAAIRAEARRAGPGQARARLQLRHRRALSLGAGLPARRGMSARVAILTPDPADEAFDSRWRDVFEEDAATLAAGRPDGRGSVVGRSGGLRGFRPRPAAADLGLSPRRPGLAGGGERVGSARRPSPESGERAALERRQALSRPARGARRAGRADALCRARRRGRLARGGGRPRHRRADRQAPGLRLGLADDPLVAGRAARRRPGRRGDDPALPPRHPRRGRDLADLRRRRVQPRHPQAPPARRLPSPARI